MLELVAAFIGLAFALLMPPFLVLVIVWGVLSLVRERDGGR